MEIFIFLDYTLCCESLSASHSLKPTEEIKKMKGWRNLREAAGASGQCRYGPLLEVRWALWVFLQGFHDLTLVQHEFHELVLPLGLGGGTVKMLDELQLLQVLECLGKGEG